MSGSLPSRTAWLIPRWADVHVLRWPGAAEPRVELGEDELAKGGVNLRSSESTARTRPAGGEVRKVEQRHPSKEIKGVEHRHPSNEV